MESYLPNPQLKYKKPLTYILAFFVFLALSVGGIVISQKVKKEPSIAPQESQAAACVPWENVYAGRLGFVLTDQCNSASTTCWKEHRNCLRDDLYNATLDVFQYKPSAAEVTAGVNYANGDTLNFKVVINSDADNPKSDSTWFSVQKINRLCTSANCATSIDLSQTDGYDPSLNAWDIMANHLAYGSEQEPVYVQGYWEEGSGGCYGARCVESRLGGSFTYEPHSKNTLNFNWPIGNDATGEKICGYFQIDYASQTFKEVAGSGALVADMVRVLCEGETAPPPPGEISCTSLTKAPPSPAVGDELTFTCMGSGDDIDRVVFKIKAPGGSFEEYPCPGATCSLSTNTALLSYPEPAVSGNYIACSKVCTAETCTEYDERCN